MLDGPGSENAAVFRKRFINNMLKVFSGGRRGVKNMDQDYFPESAVFPALGYAPGNPGPGIG